jgi:UDP-glucose 4-epimerase
MTILVAGATGLVGSAIVRNLQNEKIDFMVISSSDVNLLDREATFTFIEECKPSVIIDAAAKVGGIQANNDYSVEFLSENIRIQCNLMDAAHNFNVDVKDITYLSVIVAKKASTVSSTTAIFSPASILSIPNNSSLPPTSKMNFIFYVNGVFLPHDYVTSFVDNSNNTCTLTIDAAGLGYYLTDKEVTAIGKFQ